MSWHIFHTMKDHVPKEPLCFRPARAVKDRLRARAKRMTAALHGAGSVTMTGLLHRFLVEGLDRLDASDPLPPVTDEK
jgi:hypothetical protein